MEQKEGYVLDVDLYRVGNAASPRLDFLRERDIDQFFANGIAMVRANGLGISIATLSWLKKRGLNGHVYLLEKGVTVIPGGLILAPAPAGSGHYHIAPLHTMSLQSYLDLLRILGTSCVYAGRIEELSVEA